LVSRASNFRQPYVDAIAAGVVDALGVETLGVGTLSICPFVMVRF